MIRNSCDSLDLCGYDRRSSNFFSPQLSFGPALSTSHLQRTDVLIIYASKLLYVSAVLNSNMPFIFIFQEEMSFLLQNKSSCIKYLPSFRPSFAVSSLRGIDHRLIFLIRIRQAFL